MLHAYAAACDAPIRGLLCARKSPAPRLPGWHDHLDVWERERQKAKILEQPAPGG
jgi:hypothetical protein